METLWPVLLTVSTTTWLSHAPTDDSGSLWLCRADAPPRQLDLTHPVWCLPLLERPRADVDAELDQATLRASGAVAEALRQLVPGGLVAAAITSASTYWLGLACDWLSDLVPSEETQGWAEQIEGAPTADQRTRHLARRIRRR